VVRHLLCLPQEHLGRDADFPADGNGVSAAVRRLLAGIGTLTVSRSAVAVAQRVPSGRPDHATIARFIVRHEQRLAELFTSVLQLCAKAGLVESGGGGRRHEAVGQREQ
jgi:hypothetical protein